MAQLLDGSGTLGWVLLKCVFRFAFMIYNNCVAIPSYCLYMVLLQPLRIWDSSTFWHVEGIMFKWLLSMVSSWGWIAGYTGECQWFKHIAIVPRTALHANLIIIFCMLDLITAFWCTHNIAIQPVALQFDLCLYFWVNMCFTERETWYVKIAEMWWTTFMFKPSEWRMFTLLHNIKVVCLFSGPN